MSKILVVLFCQLLLIINASASFKESEDFFVVSFESDQEILIQSRFGNQLNPGMTMGIFSHESNEVVGYATVKNTKKMPNGKLAWVAKVRTHNAGSLVRPGNYLHVMYLKGYTTDVPGRLDLLVDGDKSVSARYKPLVYLGYFTGETAATVMKDEHLFGLSLYAYGISDQLQIETYPIIDAYQIGNLGVKFRLFQNDEYRLSVLFRGYYSFKKKESARDFEAFLDIYSNSSFVSYLRLSLQSKRPKDTPLEPSKHENIASSELQ